MSERLATQPRKRRRLVLLAVMLAMFMAAVEATIVATAMPSIIADLGGFQLFSWVFAIYLLCQAASAPIYGKLADIFGRKPAFYAGAALFLAGSTLAGLAPSMLWLIVYRALQGLGAGAIQPIATTIVGDIYAPEERGRVQGYLSAAWGFAAVIGPALGAFFVEHVSWSLVFWINLPVGAASLALLALFLDEEKPHKSHAVDYLGAALLMAGTTALMLALIQGASLPPGLVAGLLLAAAGLLAFFFYVERRVLEPIMPLGLWKQRVIVTGNLGQLFTGAVMIGAASFVPTYVQGVIGGTPAAAGLAIAAMSISWPLASAIGGRLMVATSFRLTAVLGSLILVLGSAVLAMLTPERGVGFATAASFLVGLGMGFTNSTYVVAVQTSVGWQERGAATSASIFMRMLGQAMGAAIFGAMLNYGVGRDAGIDTEVVNRMLEPAMRGTIAPALLARVVQAMADSLHGVFLLAALLSLAALAVAVRLPGHLNPTNALKAKEAA
ncbi:MAG: MDR family MFS transporter [Alphaproteobacteria bacterium]